MKNIFKKNNENAKLYMVEDDTVMPIVCDSYEKALEIVNTEFNGEIDRIYYVGR